jgi:hypothetical protein
MINRAAIAISLTVLWVSMMMALTGCPKEEVPEGDMINNAVQLEPTMAAEKSRMHERSKRGP